MPNRYIKETCVTSPTLTALSDSAERFFWRLTTVADDYGRFDANPAVLLGRCVPTLGWSFKKVEKCLHELTRIAPGDEIPAVQIYTIKDRLYGFLTTWTNHQRDRSKDQNPPKPKFPDPKEGIIIKSELITYTSITCSTIPKPSAANCGGLRQNAALNESESEDDNEDDNDIGIRRETPRSLPPPKLINSRSEKRTLRSIDESDAPTDKHRAFAQQLKIDIGPEWGKFKNYCLAHDKRYANFSAAFRNWLARSAEMKGERRVL